MTYKPGAAFGASIEPGSWALILVRELKHPPQLVWDALTDPTRLSQWAPFDADRNLGSTGPVTLTGGGQVADGTVKRAEAPRLLEYTWGGKDLRWELHPTSAGTRLTLWHNIDRGYIAWGAAGWHICFDVMDRLLSGDPIGRIVGKDAMQSDGWQRLMKEYATQFEGVTQ